MDDRELYDVAMECALELPGTEAYPFAEGWEAVRVGGKWFLLATMHDGQIINVKADPEDAVALAQAHGSITPGYHMNKKHWITLRAGSDMDGRLVRELVTNSYLAVVEKLPKSRRPVGPASV